MLPLTLADFRLYNYLISTYKSNASRMSGLAAMLGLGVIGVAVGRRLLGFLLRASTGIPGVRCRLDLAVAASLRVRCLQSIRAVFRACCSGCCAVPPVCCAAPALGGPSSDGGTHTRHSRDTHRR